MVLVLPLLGQRSPDWFQSNDRGNRYEGTYTRKVSNLSIDLVSLTGFVEPYTFGEKQMLKAKFYCPAKASYQFNVEELIVSHFYWMQDKQTAAREGWNTFENWPVDYLLKSLGITHRNLGILVHLDEASARNFVPVLLFHSQAPQEVTRYVAQLRLGRSAADGRYKVYQGENRNAAALLLQGNISAKSGGTTFPLIIPATQLKEGWLSVEVNLREQGSLAPYSYNFRFYHKNP